MTGQILVTLELICKSVFCQTEVRQTDGPQPLVPQPVGHATRPQINDLERQGPRRRIEFS